MNYREKESDFSKSEALKIIPQSVIDGFRLPPDTKALCSKICHENDMALKNIFKDEIRGSFLIEIKYRVTNAIAPIMLELYEMKFTVEESMIGGDDRMEFDICKQIIGVHKSNTVFLSKEERSHLEKSEEYKKKLSEQVLTQVFVRKYGSVFFRQKPIMAGERYIYYPVPYDLFVMCTRMNQIFSSSDCVINDATALISLIMNKSMAALSLLEDCFTDAAYMPCRTVIEMYAKLILLRSIPKLFEIYQKFASFDLDKTCCSQHYPAEFNRLYENRMNRSCKNKVDYLHYGFVDSIPDYHTLVKTRPYSIEGIFRFLSGVAKEQNNVSQYYSFLYSLYLKCSGYTHGNVNKSLYPVLHYFEISLMLGYVVPTVYQWLCEDNRMEDTKIFGVDISDKFDKDFAVLVEQYQKLTTENLNLENAKNNVRK